MKKILITGTSKGLGNFLANHFLKNGDYVIGLSRTPSEISHPCYEEYTIDISDNAQVIKTIHCLNEIDVLINNAAISMMNSFFTSPIEMLDQIYKLNVRAPYFLTQEISKKMLFHGKGTVINISTIALGLKIAGESQYLISKAALEEMTHSLSIELQDFGIKIYNIRCPLLETNLTKSVPSEKLEDLKRASGKYYNNMEEIFLKITELIYNDNVYTSGSTIILKNET